MAKQNYRIRFLSNSEYISHASYTQKQKNEMLSDMDDIISRLEKNNDHIRRWGKVDGSWVHIPMSAIPTIQSEILNAVQSYTDSFNRHAYSRGYQPFGFESMKDMLVSRMEEKGFNHIRDLVYRPDDFRRMTKTLGGDDTPSDAWASTKNGNLTMFRKKQVGGR